MVIKDFISIRGIYNPSGTSITQLSRKTTSLNKTYTTPYNISTNQDLGRRKVNQLIPSKTKLTKIPCTLIVIFTPNLFLLSS